MKKIALLVSGCGFKDGAEITEAVSSWICLTQLGAQVEVFSLDLDIESQSHLSEKSTGSRNLMDETARIFRGQVKNIEQLESNEFDGLVIPGGYGVALHFCNWASQGSACEVHPQVEKVLQNFFQAQKPIGAWCIAPALLARVFGAHQPTLTIGSDAVTSAEIEKTGASHEKCSVTEFVSDRAHRIVTTPAYMEGSALPHQVFEGIQKACRELVEMS